MVFGYGYVYGYGYGYVHGYGNVKTFIKALGLGYIPPI